MNASVTDLYINAAEHMDRIVAAVGPDDWDRPTPCAEWDVAALVRHVTDEQRWAGPLLDGLGLDEAGTAVAAMEDAHSTATPGEPLRAAWSAANQSALDAARRTAPGATVEISRGRVTAEEFLEEMFADQLIHGWDLARAVRASDRLPPDLVNACAEWFPLVEDAWRQGGSVGPRVETPTDADPQERLLAAFGRSSRWTPGE
jgi:uncharacterized protein (TIGR03086 family)